MVADGQGTLEPPAGGSAVPVPGRDAQPALRSPSGRLVVGFDRTPASLAALEAAIELGRRLGAEIVVVHAVDLADLPVDPDAEEWEADAGAGLAAGRAAVADVLGGYECGWSYRTVRGDPAAALVTAGDQWDAWMIVVGSRPGGVGKLVQRLVSPSVGHRLVGRAGRPVLVVGPRGPATRG